MNDEKKVLTSPHVCNSFSSCKIWYPKKKYNGRVVALQYLGFTT